LAGGGLHVESVASGDRFRVADTFDVLVVGEWHAVIHPDVPRVRNVCYLVDSLVFHRRLIHTTHKPVDTLLLPVYAPCARFLR